MQVELDALPPEVLRDLYQSAVDNFWDDDAFARVLARESKEREVLTKLVSSTEGRQ